MIILAIIFFSLILIKIKIRIVAHLVNADGLIIYRIGPIKIERKISLLLRNKEYIVPQKKNMKNDFSRSFQVLLKKIRIEKFHLKMKIGLLFFFATLYSVSIISTLIATFKRNNKSLIQELTYEVIPIYDEKFLIQGDVELIVKLKGYEILLLFILAKCSKKNLP